ncbi:unnamed protein product [Urochloa humidicola]
MEERFAAVTAATGALGPVLEKLAALLGDECKLQEGTRRDILSIKSELEPVHDLLAKLWGREHLDVACKDWMAEARELSYDMEDDIDSFTLGLECGHGVETTTDGHFTKFIERVKGVSNRCGEMQKIVDVFVFNGSKMATDPRALFLHKDASELVGMEEKEEVVIRLLQKHRMVCIVGFAGMGKTTLAELVYSTLGDQFHCGAFVSVHLNPNMMEILGTIHSQVTNGAPSTSRPASEQNIINDISSFLSDKRYPVIIDDIWHWEEWGAIRQALPKNNLGFRIILTTRINTIVEKCQTEQGAHVYTQSIRLSDAERLATTIILNKSFERGILEAGPSREIAYMSGAMPLAVICLSSAWAESRRQGDRWEWDTWESHVLDSFLTIPSLKPLVRSLCIGLDDLPVHLRTCLLYCGIYPQEYEIERGCLVRKWIAEGFVSQDEVAETYIDKLVSRSLLQPSGYYNIYTIHPMMLAFLVCKAKEDNLLACRKYSGLGSSRRHAKKIRRLSLFTDHYPPDEEDVSHIRSLHVLGLLPLPDDVPFNKFENLRVLEIDSRGLENRHLVGICGLIRLRYLGLIGCVQITELPREIGGLQNLETVEVGKTRISKLPMEIEKLQYLKTLNVSGTKVTNLPGEIGKLKHLETLDASETSVTELPVEIEKLQCLKTLNVSSTEITGLPKEIEKLQHLRTLNISCTMVTKLPREITELYCLENLDVSCTGVRELPMEFRKLQHLRTLNISNTMVTKLPREIITELYCLEYLDVSRTGVRELPKEFRKLQHLRTLDIRMCKVRELSCMEIPNSLSSVVVGDIHSAQVVKLPLVVSSSGGKDVVSSSEANKCMEYLSILVLFNHVGSWSEVQPVLMHRVAGRHMKVPQWVRQDLCNVSSLDIRLCQLVEDDLEFLKQMPNLQALQLRFEVLPLEPIAITGGGFSKLETFYVDCRMPRVTFRSGSMLKVRHLEFKFYNGSATASPDYSMGIKNLDSLEKVVFRCSEYYTSDSQGISATIEFVRKEAGEHPNEITL